jgi:hypothetical protein
MTTITTAEILAELEAASHAIAAPDGYCSIAEMVAQTGLADARIRKALIAAKAAGRLEVARVPRETLSGAMHPTPVYRIAPAKRKK